MLATTADIDVLKKRLDRVEAINGDGKTIIVNRLPGGIIISSIAAQQRSPSIAPAPPAQSAGGIIELHREWTDTIQAWRLNERVVYKPVESPYYIVYECNDATATPTDIPGTSSKWTKITNWVDEPCYAKEIAYTTGQKVLHLGGIYTAAADSTGVIPGTNASKWTFTAHSLLGIISYPMQIDGVDAWTPVAWYEQYDTRYEKTIDPATNKLFFGQRRIVKYLDGSMRVNVVGDLIEWANAVPHG